MTDFESEYCGYDPDYMGWDTDADHTSPNKQICGECSRKIPAGEKFHKWLLLEGFFEDDLDDNIDTIDWEHNQMVIEDYEESELLIITREIDLDPHIMCSACQDLHDSLRANGREPQFGAIHRCHTDWKDYLKEQAG